MFIAVSIMPTTCLTAPTTPTLNALKSVSDWHSLGIYLDFKTHQLDTIEKNHHGDDECMVEQHENPILGELLLKL